jgi:ABC-2 type transport system ATP-binding protein
MIETMTVAPLLEARDVRKSFGRIEALSGVSVAVRGGELVCLVGPDGAGKTTLLRALTGLVDVDDGEALIEGISWPEATSDARERLGYMPQQYGLYADLSVDENLEFFADLFGLPRREFEARRAQLLALARLEAAHDRPAGALSGGMYKKLAVACALLHRPHVLVLDEPTNGVDPVSRRELWELLYEFVREGMGVLLATPYMDEAARASRVALLSRGRIIAEGEPARLVAEFAHVVLDISVSDRATVDALLDDDPRVIAVTPAGPRLRAVVREDRAAALERALEARGAGVRRVRPDFEDLYLARVHALREASA